MKDHAAGSPLRSYQRHAVEALQDRLQAPGTRACLVAPPGAGKTRCALHVASALGVPVEVRVPTTALVQQWQARARETLVPVTGTDAPPPVEVHTYAAARPFAPGALVVLDEAHHLLERWADDVAQALAPEHRVLGLTATPPEASRGFERFLELVGTDPVEIPAPPLVRDGHLAPYQELVWPVLAEAHELVELARADSRLRMLEESLQPDLGLWERALLTEDLEALTEARFAREEGLLVALCRRQVARGGELPTDLPREPELWAEPTLEDRALVLARFAESRKDAPGGLAPAARAEGAIREALKEAGFRLAKGGPVLVEDLAWRSLSACGTRVEGCIEVLALEARARGDGLRALILTDRDHEGDRISARQVLKALVRDRRTEVLDPVLVTGTAFWIDDDLWPHLERRLAELPTGPGQGVAWRAEADHHELDVTGWSTADRVGFATALLQQGITRCLVGTRHLLGEGWDCPAVNVAIDLTGITAAVTVNQVRGRALRRDPADPSKVASLWEVLALAPGLPGGDRMLTRLQQRHEHTLGIDAQGRIRAGVGRIDPLLQRDGAQVAASAADLQAHMGARALDAGRIAARWAVGRAYADRRVWRLEGPGTQAASRARLGERPERTDLVAAGSESVQAVRQRGRVLLATTAATSLVFVLGSAAAFPLLGPLSVLLGLGSLGAGLGLGAWLRTRQRKGEDRRAAVLQALWDALHQQEPLGPLRIEAERVWVDGTPEQSRRFAVAAEELLGPVRYPRYLLHEADGSVWPVPAILGANRGTADAFSRAWARRVGPCVARWARQGQGRTLLHAAWRQGGRAAVELVEDWE